MTYRRPFSQPPWGGGGRLYHIYVPKKGDRLLEKGGWGLVKWNILIVFIGPRMLVAPLMHQALPLPKKVIYE